MKAIIELFQLIIILLHEWLFGNTHVIFEATDRYMMLNYTVLNKNYEFMSTQYKLDIRYNAHSLCRKVQYFYKVELLNCDMKYSEYYAQMCPKLLYATTYPHRLAINQHLKRSIKKGLLN